MPTPKDIELYNRVKKEADLIYKKPSAFKSGYIVKKYKELGGEYIDDKKPKNLKRWFKEDWKDIAGLDYPVFRPTKRVNKNTPLTPQEIDPKNLKEQAIIKQIIKGEHNLSPFKPR
jgi:hypothetical protein